MADPQPPGTYAQWLAQNPDGTPEQWLEYETAAFEAWAEHQAQTTGIRPLSGAEAVRLGASYLCTVCGLTPGDPVVHAAWHAKP